MCFPLFAVLCVFQCREHVKGLLVTWPSLRWMRGFGKRQFSLSDFFLTRVTFFDGKGLPGSFKLSATNKEDLFNFGKEELCPKTSLPHVLPLLIFDVASLISALSRLFLKLTLSPSALSSRSLTAMFKLSLSLLFLELTRCSLWSPSSSAVVGKFKRAAGSSPTTASCPQDSGRSFSFSSFLEFSFFSLSFDFEKVGLRWSRIERRFSLLLSSGGELDELLSGS